LPSLIADTVAKWANAIAAMANPYILPLTIGALAAVAVAIGVMTAVTAANTS
jgi:hypothetical protein